MENNSEKGHSTKIPLSNQLNGWDGVSMKGQSVYNEIFEQEKERSLKEDCRLGICTCCEDSMYYNM